MHGPPSRRAVCFLGVVISRQLIDAGESPAPPSSLTGRPILVEHIVQRAENPAPRAGAASERRCLSHSPGYLLKEISMW
jgi:hypothetical protein